MIYGERILQAREMRDLTQKALADKVGCTQTAIAKFEADVNPPSESLLCEIAGELGFLPPWFTRPPATHFPLGSLQFRAKATRSQRQVHKPYYVARTVFEVAEFLRSRVKSVPIRLHRNAWSNAAEAAIAMRSECGLSPNAPVPDVLYAIEKLGVVVLALPIDLELKGVEGFSSWTEDGIPVICLSMLAPGDRIRYTAAHELGELTLSALPPGEVRHEAADIFAGEFLLPEEAMRREIVTPVSLTSLAKLKLRWRVSIAALAMRAARLEIISSRHLRTLFVDLSRRGWRTAEPANLAVEPERPRVFRKMVEVLYGDPIDYDRFALECHLKPMFARRLVQTHLARPAISQAGAIVSVDFAGRKRA